MGADEFDPPDSLFGDPEQIYDQDVAPYESLLVGIFQVHKGPNNAIADKRKFPKMSELNLGFTRDGFHWHRPVRTPFIAAMRKVGDWQRAYLHFTDGVMLVVGDRLLFNYSSRSGDAPNGPDMYAGGSTGVAFLRRDCFASMDGNALPGNRWQARRRHHRSDEHCRTGGILFDYGDFRSPRERVWQLHSAARADQLECRSSAPWCG